MKLIKFFLDKKLSMYKGKIFFLFLSKVGTGTVTFQKSELKTVKDIYGFTTLPAGRPSGEGG
jgi:hypothetical protein